MADNELGVSLRFIQKFRPLSEAEQYRHDMAWRLAVQPTDEDDERTFAQRLRDAYEFLDWKQRQLH